MFNDSAVYHSLQVVLGRLCSMFLALISACLYSDTDLTMISSVHTHFTCSRAHFESASSGEIPEYGLIVCHLMLCGTI